MSAVLGRSDEMGAKMLHCTDRPFLQVKMALA